MSDRYPSDSFPPDNHPEDGHPEDGHPADGHSSDGPSEDELSAYFDGQLTPGERRRIEAALDRDPGSRAVLDDLALLEQTLAASGSLPPDSHFDRMHERVRTRIETEDAVSSAGWTEDHLSAYVDGELTLEARAQAESLLAVSLEARASVEDYRFLQELGPLVLERMPAEHYWLDLPDRVLTRIRMEAEAGARVGTAAAAADEPWWRRLWSPAGRWAAATAAVAVVGFGLYAAAGERGNPVLTASNPVSPNLNPVDPASLTTGPGEPAVEEYRQSVQRYFTTLSPAGGTLGTTMDVVPRYSSSPNASSGPSPIERVSLGGPEPRSNRWIDDVRLPGAAPIDPEFYLRSALEFERSGRSDLAQTGYRIAIAKTGLQDDIGKAASAGLTRCAIRKQVVSAGPRGPEKLASYLADCERLYAEHVAGNHAGCQQAWNYLVSIVDLVPDHGAGRISADTLRRAAAQRDELRRCIQ